MAEKNKGQNPKMKQPKKITRQEANEIIADWQKSGKPHKQVVGAYKGQWYDFRELNDQEILAFAEKLTGKRITKIGHIDI
jgi:cytoplasmic iron level regulating protein YaaA (DUF328/UPF0246 family)